MSEISYEQFGVNFVTNVVTPERVAATIARLAGGEVKAGPMPAGPGGAASVTATGRIGEIRPHVSFTQETLGFRAIIPIDLELEVRVVGGTYRYRGSVNVPLRLGVRAVEPVTIVIDVATVSPDDVEVKLAADGVRAKVLQRLGNIEEEVRRTVTGIVNERLASEEAQAARHLNVLGYVDLAWKP